MEKPVLKELFILVFDDISVYLTLDDIILHAEYWQTSEMLAISSSGLIYQFYHVDNNHIKYNLLPITNVWFFYMLADLFFLRAGLWSTEIESLDRPAIIDILSQYAVRSE